MTLKETIPSAPVPRPSRLRGKFSLGLLVAGLLALCGGARADVYIYPGDNFIFDVTAYGANGGDALDDTVAIQAAIEAILVQKRSTQTSVSSRHHTLYFPDGVYRVSGSLTFGAETSTGPGGASSTIPKKLHVKGQSRAGARIVLAAGTFTDGANPVPVLSLFDGDFSNSAFANTVEDLTIEIESNNAGAIGLRYHNNNYGYIKRVTLRSLDATRRGKYGIDLGSNLAGIGLVKDVAVTGFDFGIENAGNFKISFVLEDITLSGQRIAGIRNRDKGMSIRRLHSTNSVPALWQRSVHSSPQQHNAQVIILDSELLGGGAAEPAIEITHGWVLARNITTAGYGSTVLDRGTPVTLPPDGEHVSEAAHRLWTNAPAASLRLPIEDPPEIPADPQNQWAVVQTTSGDATAAIQAAIDSGASTVFLKRGVYEVSDTIFIRGAVRRLHGNCAMLNPTQAFVESAKPQFQFEDGTPPAVLIESFDMAPFAHPKDDAPFAAWFMQHNSSRTLIMRHIHTSVGASYRNEGTGKLFIEGFFGSVSAEPGDQVPVPGWIFKNQQVWARHFNQEGMHPHMWNQGGRVWILGAKYGEGHGPFIRTTLGGQTEVLGAVFNNLANSAIYIPGAGAIESVDSDVAVAAYETSLGGGQQPHPIMVKETQGAETRTLLTGALTKRSHNTLTGKVLPLFSGRRLNFPATYVAVDDAFVRSGVHQGSNYGGNALLTVKNGGGADNDRDSYLRFDLAAAPAEVLSATIRLSAVDGSGGEPVRAELVADETWTEGTIVWTNKPPSATTLAEWTPTAGSVAQFDVTAAVQAALAGTRRISLRLFAPVEAANGRIISYASSENGDVSKRPLLILGSAVSQPVSITASDAQAGEWASDPGAFTLTRPGSAGDLPVFLDVGGTATPGAHFTTLPGFATIPHGQSTLTLPVLPVTDAIAQGTRSIIASLQTNVGYTLGAPASATVQLADLPMDAWRFQHFGANANTPAIAGDFAAPMQDGVPNLSKYALGLNPNLPATGDMLPRPAMDASGHLLLAYPVPPPDILVRPEVSGNLGLWNHGPAFVGVSTSGGTNTARDLILGDRRFIRLDIQRQTP